MPASDTEIFEAIREFERLTGRRLPTVVAALRDAVNHGGFRSDFLLRDIRALTAMVTLREGRE